MLNKIDSNNTYTDLYGIDNDKVVFGNSDADSEFQSHVKMEFWGEDDITLYEDGVKGDPVLKGEILELDLASVKTEWIKEGNDLRWIHTFNLKPASNKIVYKFGGDGWKQFHFAYQTPLREVFPDDTYDYFTDEKGYDCVRITHPPENPDGVTWRRLSSEGSYVGFHNTKRNHRQGGTNYRNGSALRISRSRAVDADGKWVWVDLDVDNNGITETIPQSFLDTAKYPVRVNATLGFISGNPSGGTASGLGTAACYVFGAYTATEDGEATHVSIFLKDASSSDVTLVFYNDTGGTYPDAIQGEGQNASATAADAYLTIALDNEVVDFTLTNGAKYWTGYAAGENLNTYYDANGFNRKDTPEAYAGGGVAAFDDPYPGAIGGVNRDYSTYITYTPAGVAPTGQVIIIQLSKLLPWFIPLFWLKQGKTKRRDFLKNTLATLFGIK